MLLLRFAVVSRPNCFVPWSFCPQVVSLLVGLYLLPDIRQFQQTAIFQENTTKCYYRGKTTRVARIKRPGIDLSLNYLLVQIIFLFAFSFLGYRKYCNDLSKFSTFCLTMIYANLSMIYVHSMTFNKEHVKLSITKVYIY